jgi:hypothetical protein
MRTRSTGVSAPDDAALAGAANKIRKITAARRMTASFRGPKRYGEIPGRFGISPRNAWKISHAVR